MTSFVTKGLLGGLMALAVAGTVVTPASAGDGGAVAAGVVGGLALGAIAGSAAANARPGYYAPAYGAPAYAAPYGGGGCYFQRQPVYDEYGEVIGHRRVRVCE